MSVLNKKAPGIDLTGLPDDNPEVDLTGLPDQDPIAPSTNSEIDLAGLPDQDELTPGDILKSSMRNIPIPQLGGANVGQVSDLLKADKDTQNLIKTATKYPYELFTNQVTPEQYKDASETEFETMIRGAFPGSDESPSTMTQFALNMTSEMVDWGTKPSAWLALAAMRKYSKPLLDEVMKHAATRYPRTHAFMTKEYLPKMSNTGITEKLARGEKLTPKEQKFFNDSFKKGQEIARQEVIREKAEAALGQKMRSGETSRAQGRVDRGTEMKLLTGPGESVVETPLANNPVRVYDSRVGGPLEVSNLAVDSAGKPITLGMDEVGVVVESLELGLETIVTAAEPEIIQALKAITEKINDYTSAGRRVPESLTKRQKAIMGALEVPGKEGANIPASKIIGVLPSDKVTMSESALLKAKIKTLARGYRGGRTVTTQQMQENMQALKQLVNDSNLSDKTKLLGRLTNIAKLGKNPADFKAVVIEVQTKIDALETIQEKTVLKNLITKELKRSKPVKQGSKKVAKYDYENNKILEDLRNISKLTKADAQAQLDALSKTDLSATDLIKMRALSFKANGAASSVELRTQLLEDIRDLKARGKAAKSEELFQKQLERRERVEEFEKAVEKTKGDVDTVGTKFVNAYIRGVSNTGSAINAVAGKDMARKYDPEIKQLDKVTAIFEAEAVMMDGAVETLGVNNRWELHNKLTELRKAEIEAVDVKGKPEKLSKMQLLDIYNAIKHPLFRARYEKLYGEEQLEALVFGNLNGAELAFGDFMMESLKDYYAVYNEHYLSSTGQDLLQREPYWPGSSESTAAIFDEMKQNSQTPSAEKELSKSDKVVPKPADAWDKALFHMKAGEHVRHLSPAYEELKRLLSDRDIRLSIEGKFGKKIYKNLLDKVERISLTHYVGNMDVISEGIGRVISNWTGAKVAVPNITSPLRQLVSVINYAEKMPVGTWVSGFGDSIGVGKATWDYMWERAPWLKARFRKGYSENVARAIQDTMRLPGTDMSWAEAGSILTRMGDVGAIVYGGYPYVKWLQTPEGGGLTEAEAFEEFKWSIKGQQSPLSSGLSDFQNSRHWGNRALFNFKNTVSQYMRKNVDAILNYINDDISGAELSKKLAIYWLANSVLIAAVGRAVHEGIETAGEVVRGEDIDLDPGETMQDILLQTAISPTVAIPFVEDAISFALRWALKGKKPQKIFQMGFLEDLEAAVRGLSKVNVSFKDYMNAVGVAAELGVGVNVKSGMRYWEIFMGQAKNKDSVAALKKQIAG